jgi:hypothetical protein
VARGWESKDVESQVEDRKAERKAAAAPKLTAAEQEVARKRAAIELDRVRITKEIAATQHERRRQQLEAALKHLDRELAKL